MPIYYEVNLEKAISKGFEKFRSLSEGNRKAIDRFFNECYVQGMTKLRIWTYMTRIRMMQKWIVKDFQLMTKEDVKELARKIEQSEYADWTKIGIKIALRKIFQVINGLEWNSKKYPEVVEWMQVKKNKNGSFKDILTQEEVKRIISAMENSRDRAFVSVLYESGCRIGEIMSLKIKDINFDDQGAVIQITGKTGQRPVRLVFSTISLSNWLANHPTKDYGESYVWTKFNRNYKNGKVIPSNRITYDYMSKMLKIIAKRQGITKPVNFHNFRHTRASHLANKLTEAQMNIFFGWTQGSSMSRTYVHLSGRDVNDAILRIYGKLPEQKTEDVTLKAKLCPRCFLENSPESDYCMRCRMPLTQKAVEEVGKREKEMLSLITPDIIERMIENKVSELMKRKIG